LEIAHKKNAPERFAKEALPHLRAYAAATVRDVEAELERAARKIVAAKDEEVLEWLRAHDFSKKEGEQMMQMARVEEGGARTLWQLAQGGTALARAIPFTDERSTLERLVSRLLKAAA